MNHPIVPQSMRILFKSDVITPQKTKKEGIMVRSRHITEIVITPIFFCLLFFISEILDYLFNLIVLTITYFPGYLSSGNYGKITSAFLDVPVGLELAAKGVFF